MFSTLKSLEPTITSLNNVPCPSAHEWWKKITKITITNKQLFIVQIRHYRASCFSLKHFPTLLTQQNSHATQNYELLKPKSVATPDKPQGGDRKSPGTPPSSPRRAPFDTDRPTYTKKQPQDHTFSPRFHQAEPSKPQN